MEQQAPAKENQDSLIEANHVFSEDKLTDLRRAISRFGGQLCVCTIDHLYISKERTVFRSPGQDRESDYRKENKHDRCIFLWKAHNNPQVSPSGALMIPTKKYLRCDREPNLRPDSLYPLRFTRETGDIVHEHLTSNPPQKPSNPPEGGWPLFFLPVFDAYSRHSLSVSFRIGNDRAYEFLVQHRPVKVTERSDRYILALTRDIRLYLDCSLPPAFEARAKNAEKDLKHKLMFEAANHWVNRNKKGIREVANDYEDLFGQSLYDEIGELFR